jgi:hypothetical protein
MKWWWYILPLFVVIMAACFVKKQEGMQDLQKYTDVIEHLFMTPPTVMSPGATEIMKPTYDKTKKKTFQVKYYVPAGWYLVMATEMLDNTVIGKIPRMTILPNGINMDPVTGGCKAGENDLRPFCISSLDITTLAQTAKISAQWDTNNMKAIEDYYKTEKKKVVAFFKSTDITVTDQETIDDLTKVDKKMNSNEDDYLIAFQKSQDELIKVKEKYGATRKMEKSPRFDPSTSRLQYDAAMPAFWDDADKRFFEPGSFRYIPSYKDSVFLSKSTGLPEYTAVTPSSQMSGFCFGPSTDAVEQKCNSLPGDVCASTECCVLLGGKKCVAGTRQGPSLTANYSDFTIQNRDFYYFQGKCFGNCPT